jgi:hypothetical protein
MSPTKRYLEYFDRLIFVAQGVQATDEVTTLDCEPDFVEDWERVKNSGEYVQKTKLISSPHTTRSLSLSLSLTHTHTHTHTHINSMEQRTAWEANSSTSQEVPACYETRWRK